MIFNKNPLDFSQYRVHLFPWFSFCLEAIPNVEFFLLAIILGLWSGMECLWFESLRTCSIFGIFLVLSHQDLSERQGVMSFNLQIGFSVDQSIIWMIKLILTRLAVEQLIWRHLIPMMAWLCSWRLYMHLKFLDTISESGPLSSHKSVRIIGDPY